MCRSRAGKPEPRTTSRGSTASGWRPGTGCIWGGGLRSTLSPRNRQPLIFFDPDNRRINQVHGFAQTEITITPALSATIGTRGERTTFSGFELQPAVRAKYTPGPDSIVWGAISRAVRTPTRFDQDLRVRVGDVVVIAEILNSGPSS